MKLSRSIIEESIEKGKIVTEHFKYALPPMAFWTRKDWENKGSEFDEIRDCMLGWDVTDFGSEDFYKIGRVLLTLRNGLYKSEKYPKGYAEKLLIDPEHQRAPAHFHRNKREDIICRAGGNILVQLTKADKKGQPTDDKFSIAVDAMHKQLQPGEIVRLKPGMSVTIPPYTIHQFWGEEGTGVKFDGIGYTISNEISTVCDDWSDNVFLEPAVRFPKINEDVEPIHYLCHEYPKST
ncbi:D-lyxose/D-mannose family sugar isomerase [Arenibacter sp. ARW7G5Y1]|uniref:D-lyxose/D-mannose family sugar isomerase n=1 Tax=Arenibacter sp. ARW7G5Y1 TaxID=2135619 RepID=UPI000D9261C2|nr:D-lyxose/D-mannose family sugar isomerase [Arenibacter sp. ARW7G5Y1]PXX21659.1 hypothetical protein C7972_1316 [Arenibacter sp. ARW7G5Y1]